MGLWPNPHHGQKRVQERVHKGGSTDGGKKGLQERVQKEVQESAEGREYRWREEGITGESAY